MGRIKIIKVVLLIIRMYSYRAVLLLKIVRNNPCKNNISFPNKKLTSLNYSKKQHYNKYKYNSNKTP